MLHINWKKIFCNILFSFWRVRKYDAHNFTSKQAQSTWLLFLNIAYYIPLAKRALRPALHRSGSLQWFWEGTLNAIKALWPIQPAQLKWILQELLKSNQIVLFYKQEFLSVPIWNCRYVAGTLSKATILRRRLYWNLGYKRGKKWQAWKLKLKKQKTSVFLCWGCCKFEKFFLFLKH